MQRKSKKGGIVLYIAGELAAPQAVLTLEAALQKGIVISVISVGRDREKQMSERKMEEW